VNAKLQVAFGSAILILFVVGVYSYLSLIKSDESKRWVRHTHEVIYNLQELLSAMESVETSYRGYVITGNDKFLEPYQDGIARTRQEEAVIRNLTADNPIQQRELPTLEALADQILEYAGKVIVVRRTKGFEVAAESVRDQYGKREMDRYRQVIRAMQDEESRLLVTRDAVSARRDKQNKAVLIFGSGLGFLIAAGAGWVAQRNAARRGRAEEALFAEKERAQVTLNSIGDAVICTDISGNITFLNTVAEKVMRWSPRESAGRPMTEVFRILDAANREVTPNLVEKAVEQNRIMHLPSNCILVRHDGSEVPIEDSVAPIHDRDGQIIGAVIVFRDVSEIRAISTQMAYAAEHDSLTGLPNRLLLNDRIGQAIAFAHRNKKHVAVLFLDLDGFKHINDSLGHSTGDKLLQSISKRLSACMRASDTVSRQGGDEFVVLLADMNKADDAVAAAKKMLQAVVGSHLIEEHSLHVDAAIAANRMLQAVEVVSTVGRHDFHVTASIGVSVYPDDGLDAEALIKNADTAMYQVKENGRQSYQFFTPAMNIRAVERQSIEEDLRRALERREFMLHYQPIIDLGTGAITGAEALIRWTHPTRGSIPPAQFIPIAEDSGIILPIGAWVLREACKQAQAWRDAGLPVITMAVNVSALEFRDKGFLEGLFAVLGEARLEPTAIELELTESVLMKHIDTAEAHLQYLKERGVRVAIDDFGTGYSSLSYLRKFPVDALKIDQSFVRQIGAVAADTAIVTAVIAMAKSLDLRVIAEGVETKDELAFLRARKCEEAQGYYFSPPVPPREFAKLLETGIPDPERRTRPRVRAAPEVA
jgi:diguanylate cyclase (GGDEF)-like protein/PAS domain S-box-containing protein